MSIPSTRYVIHFPNLLKADILEANSTIEQMTTLQRIEMLEDAKKELTRNGEELKKKIAELRSRPN
jgi:hypothetical protein